jgi:hypothetical protein
VYVCSQTNHINAELHPGKPKDSKKYLQAASYQQ